MVACSFACFCLFYGCVYVCLVARVMVCGVSVYCCACLAVCVICCVYLFVCVCVSVLVVMFDVCNLCRVCSCVFVGLFV